MKSKFSDKKDDLKHYLNKNKRILALSSFFFVLTVLMASKYPYLGDSSKHLLRAEYILENLEFPYAQSDFFDARSFVYPPVFHILMAGSEALFGAFKLVAPFMGALSVFLTDRLVGLWYDEDTAFLTALSLALFPFFFLWSSRGFVGTTITAGFLLTFYFYFRFLDSGERKFIYLSFITGGFLAAVKTYGPVASVIVGLHYLWINRENAIYSVKEFLLPGLTGILFSLPWPIRNIYRSGNPVPKVMGREYSSPMRETVSGSNLFIPPPEEVFNGFILQFFGIVHESLMKGLYMIHPVVFFAWFFLPGIIFGLLVYGARYERENTFLWIWFVAIVSLYWLGRVLSSGGWGFKFRHFITLSPLLALFMVRSYQNLPIRQNLKKIFYLGLIFVLVLQMSLGAFIFIEITSLSYGPLDEYADENIPEESRIYGYKVKELESRVDNGYEVVVESKKPGFIDPDKNFSEELYEKVDWAIVLTSNKKQLEKLERARKEGVVELKAEVNGTEEKIYGNVGRVWRVYKINKP